MSAVLSFCACSLWANASRADDASSDVASWPVEIHGFVSQGFMKTTKNDYLTGSKRGSFEFAEVGFNVTKELADNLQSGMQLFAQDLGPLGNYSPQFDWFYLDYRWQDWLGIRAGRTKIPFGLFNEVNDVDVARQPILLPQSIYQVDHREYLFAVTGGEIYGDISLGPVGALEYRAYGGTLFIDTPAAPAAGITVLSFSVPYVFGGRLLWSTPIDGLRAGASGQDLLLDGTYGFSPELLAALQGAMLVPADLPVPLPVKFRVPRWVASLEYSAHDLDLSAEYSRWTGNFESRAPLLFPPHTVNERYYAMGSYRVNSWFMPGLYYSVLYPDVRNRQGRAKHQHDLAAFFRFDLTPNWLLKLEAHMMRGTAALDNRNLNQGADPAQLAPNWAMFLIKTTAYF